MARGGDTWCILRTRGVSTMRLAESLSGNGIEAWTPIGLATKRKGRARDRVEASVPILPTFVFVRSEHIGALHRILGLLVSPHPSFSIFRYMSRIPLVADADISSLRDAEDRATVVKLKQQTFAVPIGSNVRMAEGAFAGMSGIVEQSDGKSALVAFAGNFKVTIAAWLLPKDLLEGELSNSDAAAQAA